MTTNARAVRAVPALALATVLMHEPLVTPAAAGPLAPIWTGMYVGVHGGGNWIDIQSSGGLSAQTEATVVGGYVGVNLGLGLAVVGIEADVSYETAEFQAAALPGTFSSGGLDASGTFRARVGLPVGPALLYATAGYAWTDYSLAGLTSGGGQISGGGTFEGVVYGIGAETYVLPNISLRLEALRFDYGSSELSASGAARSVEKIDPSSTVVRAGLPFHFN